MTETGASAPAHRPRPSSDPRRTSVAGVLRVVARLVLGAFLTFAGVAHLSFARAEFQAQVPRWMPVDADLVVVVSGVVEVVLGLALLISPLLSARRAAQVGVLTALFFVAIFPGNLWQYLDGVDGFGLDTDSGRLTRLFFQPVLVVWALWCTRAWSLRPTRSRIEGREPSREPG